MVRVTYVSHRGDETTIAATPGLSLMENAVANGIDGIEAVCGGNAYCGTCRVYPAPDWQVRLGERNDLETPMLESVGEDRPEARLACQIVVSEALDGLVVHLPESQT